MAGPDFDVHPASLITAAGQFSDAAMDVQQALDHAESTLCALSGMCGDDNPGRAFAAEYQPHANAALKDLQTIVTGLQHIGNALSVTAGRYEQAEQANTYPGG